MPPTSAPLSPFWVESGRPGGCYAVNPARSVGTLGGLQMFPATDAAGRADLIALVAPRPRLGVLARLRGHWIPGLITPLANAASPIGHVVICRLPRGAAPIDPARAAARSWTEAALLHQLLRPVARCLAELHRLGIAHGSVEPRNLFATGDGAVVLGPFWSAPDPGSMPSPGSMPADATPADDVQALGRTLLTLFRGPAARRIDQCTAACTLDASADDPVLPAALALLLRQMLNTDCAQRPDAAALTDPCGLLDIGLPGAACLPAFRAPHPQRVAAPTSH